MGKINNTFFCDPKYIVSCFLTGLIEYSNGSKRHEKKREIEEIVKDDKNKNFVPHKKLFPLFDRSYFITILIETNDTKK
jgi:hypothetical protein